MDIALITYLLFSDVNILNRGDIHAPHAACNTAILTMMHSEDKSTGGRNK